MPEILGTSPLRLPGYYDDHELRDTWMPRGRSRPEARDCGWPRLVRKMKRRDVRHPRGGPKPGSLDLADAMNIVTARRYGTNLLLATDQDYRVTQPLTGHHYFVLLPHDSES